VKITPAIRKRFPNVEVEGYVKAGTPAAYEALGPARFSDVSCVVCGAKIANVFETNYGPMGGDCLATLTGDDSTRKAVQQLYEKLRYLNKFDPLEVRETDASDVRKGYLCSIWVPKQVGFNEYEGTPTYSSGRCLAVLKVKPEIARAIIEDQGFRLLDPARGSSNRDRLIEQRPKSPGGKKRHAGSGLGEAVKVRRKHKQSLASAIQGVRRALR
jgi:hypothetical protein